MHYGIIILTGMYLFVILG